jgi:hypothetical protein
MAKNSCHTLFVNITTHTDQMDIFFIQQGNFIQQRAISGMWAAKGQ